MLGKDGKQLKNEFVIGRGRINQRLIDTFEQKAFLVPGIDQDNELKSGPSDPVNVPDILLHRLAVTVQASSHIRAAVY
jgi:hypothetical protein